MRQDYHCCESSIHGFSVFALHDLLPRFSSNQRTQMPRP